MTEYQRRQIAAYLPSPRDKTLNDFEYYVLDTADRVRKAYVREILPHDEETTYGCYEVSTNRRIDAGWGNEFIGFRFGELYDNAVGRVLPSDYLWYRGDGRRNYFRDAYKGGSVWDWTLESPYET